MQSLTKEDLNEVRGGATKLMWYAIGALVTLAIGIIDGIINPNKCISK